VDTVEVVDMEAAMPGAGVREGVVVVVGEDRVVVVDMATATVHRVSEHFKYCCHMFAWPILRTFLFSAFFILLYSFLLLYIVLF